MNELKNRLEVAYAQLKKVQVNHYLAEKTTKEAGAHLNKLKLEGIASGEVQGKNATEREASAREKYAIAYQYFEDAEDKAAGERLRLDLARLNVELCRALIRLEEINIGRLPNDGH